MDPDGVALEASDLEAVDSSRRRIPLHLGEPISGCRVSRLRMCHDSRVVSFLIKVGVNAVAIWLATLVVPGVGVGAQGGDTGALENILTFLAIGLIFGLVNAAIKPIVKLLSLPFYIITLGLFAFLVNAFMLQITEWISNATSLTFYIEEFLWDAILAALVVSFVSMIINLLLPD